MRWCDLYGMHESDMLRAKTQVEAALGIVLHPHDSSYYPGGHYYMTGMPGDEQIRLQLNWDDKEREYAEPAYNEYPVLLEVDQTMRSEQIKASLEEACQIVLLRHERI